MHRRLKAVDHKAAKGGADQCASDENDTDFPGRPGDDCHRETGDERGNHTGPAQQADRESCANGYEGEVPTTSHGQNCTRPSGRLRDRRNSQQPGRCLWCRSGSGLAQRTLDKPIGQGLKSCPAPRPPRAVGGLIRAQSQVRLVPTAAGGSAATRGIAPARTAEKLAVLRAISSSSVETGVASSPTPLA